MNENEAIKQAIHAALVFGESNRKTTFTYHSGNTLFFELILFLRVIMPLHVNLYSIMLKGLCLKKY